MPTSEAEKKAMKKYDGKSMKFSVGYVPGTEKAEGRRVKKYLNDTGQSANSYLKKLIKDDLDEKEFPYPDDDIDPSTWWGSLLNGRKEDDDAGDRS